MSNDEMGKIVEEKVAESAAHYFGMMKEWMADQFGLMHESIESHKESMDRNMEEFRNEINRTNKNTDDNTLEIVGLQKEQNTIKSDVKDLKKKYA